MLLLSFSIMLIHMSPPPPSLSLSLSLDELNIILDWLLSQAVSAEFSDHAGEYNSLSKMWVLGGSAGGIESKGKGGKDKKGNTFNPNDMAVLDCK